MPDIDKVQNLVWLTLEYIKDSVENQIRFIEAENNLSDEVQEHLESAGLHLKSSLPELKLALEKVKNSE